MNSFSITRTGTYLTIQDFGRFHLQHLGISSSGAMDQRILSELAKVIPNHENQFLEFAYVGPSLKVQEGAIKVSVGGHCKIFVQKKNNTQIIPIDSEHNAIFQCLLGERGTDDVQKIIITASGGPFLNSSILDLKDVTVAEALNHPNWNMGSKVTIDSATLVNKCLELIEARYLFDLDEKYFELVVHPQSIIHSIVTYIDGSSICQMSHPDMTVPIAHALSGKNRISNEFSSLDFTALNLSFQEFPPDRMEIQDIAREVCRNGGLLGTIFNAANEIAVESFLKNRINFDKIYEVIYRTFNNNIMSNDLTIESIYEVDEQTRIQAEKVVESITN